MKYLLSFLLLLPIGLRGAGFDPIAKFPGVRSDGPLGMGITTNITLALGTNNITTYRQGYVRLNSPAGDPLTVTIELSTGSFTGCMLMLQNAFTGSAFTLFNNSPLWDDPTAEVYLRNGSWVSTDINDTLLLVMTPRGWAEVARIPGNVSVITGDNLWNMTNGVMYTVPQVVTNGWEFRESGIPQFTVATNGALFFGPTSVAFWGGSPGTFVDNMNPELGDPNYNELWFGVGRDPSNGASVDLTATTNTMNWVMQTAYGSTNGQIAMQTGWSSGQPTVANLGLNLDGVTRFLAAPYLGSTVSDSIATNAPYIMDTSTLVTNMTALLRIKHLGTNQLSFGPDPRITWGTGASNSVFQLGDDLAYTNAASGAFWNVGVPIGKYAKYGVNSSGGAVITSSETGQPVQLTAGGASGGLYVTPTSLQPGTETISLGTAASNGAWTNGYVKGQWHNVDTNDGAGNSAWLSTYASNGIAVLDYQNAGTGTPFSKLSVRSNGVEIASLPGSSGGDTIWTNDLVYPYAATLGPDVNPSTNNSIVHIGASYSDPRWLCANWFGGNVLEIGSFVTTPLEAQSQDIFSPTLEVFSGAFTNNLANFKAALFRSCTSGDSNVTSITGLQIEYDQASSGTTTNVTGINIALGTIEAGAVQTLTGLNISDQTLGTTNYALKTGAGRVRFGDAIETGGDTNRWIFKGLTIDGGGVTNVNYSVNGTNLTMGNVTSTGASVAGQILVLTGTDGKSVAPTNALPSLQVSDALFGAMAVSRGAIAQIAGVATLDFSLTNRYATLQLATATITIATSNLSPGKIYDLVIVGTNVNCTPTFPAWKWYGGAPPTITANQFGNIRVECGTTDATSYAQYRETQ